MALSGIQYTHDPVVGSFVHIDLEKHGNNRSLEDFLDGVEAMSVRGGETVPLREFMAYQNEKRGLNV